MNGSVLARRAVLAGLVGAVTCSAPAAASTSLLDTSVVAGKAKARSCLTPRVAAAGTATQRLTVPADGYLSARLTAARGDWDVAVLDRRSGRRIAGSAGFGANELAQGFVRRGEVVTVQACRRNGKAARSAKLQVSLVRVDLDEKLARPIQLVDVHTPTREKVELLTTLGLDLTEHGEDGVRGAVLSTDAEERLLRAAGFSWTVTVPDLAAASKADRAADRRFAAKMDGTALPSEREGYRRLADFEQEMKDLVRAHPDLVKPITLPLKSLEGRDINGIEITPNVDAQDGKPVFLMTGVHHAREWPSAENPFEFAYELVKGYGTDDRITRLLDGARVIVVPVMNPDGYNLSREAPDDGTLYEYKRKNCRVAPTPAPHAPGACALMPDASGTGAGVDPNRNYGGDWGGPGASNLDANATYRGTGPFSEPEVANVRKLISSRQVTTFITNHTQGSLILRPPGIAAFGLAKDEGIYKALGDSMAEHNGYTSQFSWQLYDTSGTAEGWSYYATGGLGFTFEIHRGNFHLAYEDAVVGEYLGPTSRDGEGGNREAYFEALEHTVDTTKHGVIHGTAEKGTTITVSKTVDGATSRVQPPVAALPWGEPLPVRDTLSTTTVVERNGTFDLHVNPSTSPDVYGGRAPAGPTTQDITYTTSTTGDREFTVAPGEDNGAVKIRVDSAGPGDDFSIDLFTKAADGTLTRVARSAVASRSFEEVEYVHAIPGTYVLRVTAVRALQPGTVKIDFVAPQPPEAWTVTCTPPGGEAKTSSVVIDRGQKVDLGQAC